jgi:hypothetical protein
MKNIILIIITLFSLVSCEMSPEVKLFQSGKYHGGFKIVYPIGFITTDTIYLSIHEDRYEYSSSSSLNYGSGHFIEKSNSIEFEDEVLRFGPWAWTWILSGTYNLSAKDDTIFLEKVTSSAHYSYRLLRE